MDGSHPKNIDPRPKRRRDEENPYEIYTTGINTTHPRYFLAFTDSNKVKRWMEIDKALFDAFNEFELDDLSFFNEVDRHYERSEVTEATLNRRARNHRKAWKKSFLSRWRWTSYTEQSPNCLKNSVAVWCCTILGSLHTNKLQIWRDVSTPL